MVGKWHLSPDNETGGDFSSDYTDQQANVKQRGYDYVDGLYIGNLNLLSDPSFGHHLEWMTEKALEFMDGAISSSTPFFLYFNPTMPHTPEVKESLDGTFSEYETPAGTLETLPDLSQYCSTCSMPARADVWKAWKSTTASSTKDKSIVASVYWIDQALGVFYDYLTEKDELDNTYVIIMSDNGNGKGTVYEQGCRTSLFMRGPTITAGTIITDLVSNLDIAPTLLDLAGADASELDMDGISLVDRLAGTSTSLSRTEIFLEMAYDRAVVQSTGIKYYSVPSKAKYSNNLATSGVTGMFPAWGEEDQLYDLTTDGAEQTNIASSAASDLASAQALMTAHKAATLNSPFSASSGTTTTTTTQTCGTCKSWCSTKADDQGWDTICGWTACVGCSSCC
jgi:arylsulfatase A-like enzyme